MNTRPYLVVEWNDTESDARGWMAVHNFVNHYAGGGIRMHPTVTRDEVERLACMMAYKYKASESTTTGGCKGGIAYDYRAADAKEVLRRFLLAMAPYMRAGVSLGGDLGVSYDDVLDILDDIGIGLPVTKAMAADPVVQRGIDDHATLATLTYDGFRMYDMITGYGCAAALDEAWKTQEMPAGARVVIQGFGAVGASMSHNLAQMGYKIVGISDANVLVENQNGLDVAQLIATRKPKGEIDPVALRESDLIHPNTDWLEVDCDILVPAALEDVIHAGNADRVRASLVVEAANIPVTAEADDILRARGVSVCPDFVSNLGGIRIYDVAVFGLATPEPSAIVADTTGLIRRQTRKIFERAAAEDRSAREIAKEMFLPDPSDTPDH